MDKHAKRRQIVRVAETRCPCLLETGTSAGRCISRTGQQQGVPSVDTALFFLQTLRRRGDLFRRQDSPHLQCYSKAFLRQLDHQR